MHGEQGRTPRRFIASTVVALCALAFLGLVAGGASAAPGHSVLETFGAGPGSFPQGVASDSAGNLYVLATEGGARIEKFGPAGNAVAFSGNAPYIEGNRIIGTPAGSFEGSPYSGSAVAVDDSGGPDDGNIYVAQTGAASRVFVFDSAGIYQGQLGASGSSFCSLAVGPTDGSVYVADSGSRDIYRYARPGADPAGETPAVLRNFACQMAVDGTGAVYAGSDPVVRFEADQFGKASPQSTQVFQPEGTVVSGALGRDRTSGDLYDVVHDYIANTSPIYALTAGGAQIGSPFGALTNSLGITTDPAGRVVATDQNGGVYVYAPGEVQLAKATTGATAATTTQTADVEGSVDPDGAGPVTGCRFHYGEDDGYDSGSVPCAPGGAITAPTAVTAKLTGLVSGATYHYRLFATNANGTATGADGTFTTPPATEGVTTEAATAVAKDGVDLNGSFTGAGEDVHYFFEWGRTNSYGHITPAAPGNDAGSGTGPQNVTPVHLSGLLASTVYHYRLVTIAGGVTTRGAEATVTTAPAVTDLVAEPPTNLTNSSADLNGSFTADSYETHYFFEWGPTPAYGNSTPVPPGNAVAPGSGRVQLPPVTISGLQTGATYHYRVVASNATGTTASADVTFRTAEAPVVLNPGTRNVTGGSAELTGEINPRNGQTTYRFEWGTSATYGNSIPIPDGNVGSGNSPVPVAAQITGLLSGTTYHFRLVATNQYGTTASPDQTFGFYPPACPNAQVRQETRSNTLPDCRAYELVTPSFANGALVLPLAGPPVGYATNPSKLAYSAIFGVFPKDTGNPINLAGDLYVSTRTDNGWYQKYIGLGANEAIKMGGPPKNAQENYSVGLQNPNRFQDGTQATPDLSRIIDYNDGFPGGLGQIGDWSNAPFVWDTSTGGLLERWPTNLGQVPGGAKFIGVPEASADFSHFVFSSNVVFAPGGTPTERHLICCNASPPPPEADSIYDNDRNTGQVVLASRKADGSGFQGHVLNISEDGSRILMAEELNPSANSADLTGPLYLRVNATTTDEIAAGKKIHYVGSTGDGKTVYFTSAEQLTPDDQNSGRDLYVWHESEPGRLTRVSAGIDGGSNGGGVEIIDFKKYSSLTFESALFAGQGGNGYTDNYLASKSGDIYFESPEKLVGAKGETGQTNLYLYRAGTLRYVTTMEPKPLCTKAGIGSAAQEGCSSGPVARMQVTPDGAHMALITNSHLTGYDSGEHGEMFLYNPETGRLDCASCRPDGKPPTGEVLGSQNGLFLTADGRVFFTSEDPLTPRDTDEVEDVYEYTEGRPQLISTGIGTALSEYAGVIGGQSVPGLVSVSANGTDVYFATFGSLVTQDHNGGSLKIYDARSGGGFPAERAEAPCAAADECHGDTSARPTPPVDRTSAALGKPAKKKHHKKKHHKKHHKHHKKKHHKAGSKKKRKKTPKADHKRGPKNG